MWRTLAFGLWGSKWCRQWNVYPRESSTWSEKCPSPLRWQQVFSVQGQLLAKTTTIVISCSAPSPPPWPYGRESCHSRKVRYMIQQRPHPGRQGAESVPQAEDTSTLSGAAAALQAFKSSLQLLVYDWLV